MREIGLFVEDYAHQQVIGALVQRVTNAFRIDVELDWRSATGGHGRVIQEFRNYLRDSARHSEHLLDLVIVATDANCSGLNDRVREIHDLPDHILPRPIVPAIPDPHVERWLLLDGAPFRSVVGRGCDAPDYKCERGHYKRLLAAAVRSAGVEPILGGIEYAADIVQEMDIDAAMRLDRSLRVFVDQLSDYCQQWQS